MSKKRKDKGSLNNEQAVAPQDHRGKQRSVKQPEPKAPDGISGDWT